MPYKYINNPASNIYNHNQVLSINLIMSNSLIYLFIKEMLHCRKRVKVPTIPGASVIRIDLVIQFWGLFPSQTQTTGSMVGESPFVLLRKRGLMQTRNPRGTVARSLKSQQILWTPPGIPDAAGLAKLDLPTVYYSALTR